MLTNTATVSNLGTRLTQNVEKTGDNATDIAGLLNKGSAGLVYHYFWSNGAIITLTQWNGQQDAWERGFFPSLAVELQPGWLVETIVSAKSQYDAECQFGIQDWLFDSAGNRTGLRHTIAGLNHPGKKLAFVNTF